MPFTIFYNINILVYSLYFYTKIVEIIQYKHKIQDIINKFIRNKFDNERKISDMESNRQYRSYLKRNLKLISSNTCCLLKFDYGYRKIRRHEGKEKKKRIVNFVDFKVRD